MTVENPAARDADRASRPPWGAIALLALLAILWGINWPVMKIGLTEIPPFVFRSAASVVSGCALLAIARMGGHSLRVPRHERGSLLLAAVLNMMLWNILVMYGLDLMDAGRAGILAYTMPLWATLVGALVLREPLGRRALAGLAIGMVGMALLFVEDIRVLAGPPLGPLLVLGAAFCWGAGTVVVKHARWTTPVTVAVAWQHLLGALPLLLIAVVWDWRNIEGFSFWPVMAVVYNMTVTGILCYWAFFKVVSLLPVVTSTVGTLMVPVVGVFSNALVFALVPPPLDFAALACVALAVFLVMTRRSG